MNQHNPTMKLIASAVVFTFFVTSLGITPHTFAATGVPTPEVSSLTAGKLAIPAELGQVTDTVMGDSKVPAFIHIQSAHGNYQAEKNIEKLLGYIEKNSSVKLMLLEGAANKLQPELFRLFPEHPDFNRKVTDKLMQEGYLTGPESFLINQKAYGVRSTGYGETKEQNAVPFEAFGAENLDAYKKDREAFISVVKKEKTAEKFLGSLRATIDRRFSSKLNKDLLNLVRQEEAFGSGTVSFEGWIKTLGEGSRKHLKTDLSDAFYQDQYPFLIRYFRLQAIGSKIDREKARVEEATFLKELEKHGMSKEIIEAFKYGVRSTEYGETIEKNAVRLSPSAIGEYSPLRCAFDQAFDKLPKDFSMTQWPNWTLYSQYIILMQEMEGKGLHEETVRLKDEIQTALAKTAEEKEFLAQARELYLLRRLFSLELTRGEYEELLAQQKTLNAKHETLNKSQVQNSNDSNENVLDLEPLGLKFVSGLGFRASSLEVKKVYQAAMQFYALAVDRENHMFTNALKRMNLQKQDRAVIVTGGFHADGLKKLAASKKCSYIQITPRIAEVSKRDHEVYLRAILGTQEDAVIPAEAGIQATDPRLKHSGMTKNERPAPYAVRLPSDSNMSALLGIVDRAQRVTVTGVAATKEWLQDVRGIIQPMINSENVSDRLALSAVLSRSFLAPSLSLALSQGERNGMRRGKPAVSGLPFAKSRSEVREERPDAQKPMPMAMWSIWEKLGLSEEAVLKLSPVAATILVAGITALGMTGASHGIEIDLAILNYKLRWLAQNPNSGITEDLVESILDDVKNGKIVLSGEDLNVIEQGADGQVRSMGPLDARIAHQYRVLHQSANVFVLTPQGTLLLQRRVHNKVKPLALTVFGGHVRFGHSIEQTAFNELAEESGLGKGWSFRGIWRRIDGENGFSSERMEPPNREKITNSIYFATQEETEKMREYGRMLDAKKRTMTRQQFENWLEKEQGFKDGRGETWAVYELDLKDVLQIKAVNSEKSKPSKETPIDNIALGPITRTDVFADGEEHFKLELADDLLEPLLEDHVVVETLERAVNAARINQETIVARMSDIRNLFAQQRYVEALEPIKKVLQDIRAILSVGTEPNDNFLPLLYLAQVMEKFAKGSSSSSVSVRKTTAVQILLLDSTGKKVLLQKRGLYKRLFAGKLTVSANAKYGKKSLPEAAVESIRNETGLEIRADRLTEVPSAKDRVGWLLSYDFYALTPRETEKLHAYFTAHKNDYLARGIWLDWNNEKRSLCLLSTVGPQVKDEIRTLAEIIQRETHIPWIYPVFDENHGNLLICRLNDKEESSIHQKIAQTRQEKTKAVKDLSNQGSLEVFKVLDSDEMVFETRQEIEDQFKMNPLIFALDLTGPYFGDPIIWEEVFPDFINVDDAAADSMAVSGGKGANTHVLRKLMKEEIVTGLFVPDTSVITTNAFERNVLGDPEISRLREKLGQTTTEKEIKEYSKAIRTRIMALEIPQLFQEKIAKEFERLGGKVAVRSSATVEDLKKFSGAGLAQTRLYQISKEQTLSAIKQVWASLFDDGFIAQRRAAGLSASDATMAVLIQKFIEPRASGVALSIDEHQRPAIIIGAMPGIGEGVVDGTHTGDTWRVGSLADTILERTIRLKENKVVIDSEGGTRNEIIRDDTPSLSDKEIFELARLVKLIRRYYRDHDLAKDVDVEFALDMEGRVFVVQTRSKISDQAQTKDKAFFIVRTVDEPRAKGMPYTDLDSAGSAAYSGAVTARLQILRGQQVRDEAKDKHLATTVKPGVILVAHHTNNEFNDVFAKLAGVITTDGGATSHAALNSAPLKVPCLVGAADAFEKLAQYDGQVVTFDSGRKKVYVGAAPIIEERRLVGIWDSEESQDEISALRNDEVHEIFDRWSLLEKKRKEVYQSYPEDGHLRGRSAGYRWFELDYYWKAWDRLTKYFEEKFWERSSWSLTIQERVFKNDNQNFMRQPNEPSDAVRMRLFQRITRNDPKSIYYFVKNAKNLSREELQGIFTARWEGFRSFAEMMSKIKKINEDNVEALVDGLIDVFAWMHIGFWLDVLVNQIYASDQVRYVNKKFHLLTMAEATRDLPVSEKIDKYRIDVPPGFILKLSRQKDKEIYALIEQIWSDKVLSELFENNEDPEKLAGELEKKYPLIFGKIDGWSLRFKHHSEHLDQPSDTLEYISDIRARVLASESLKFDHIVEEQCFPLFRKKEWDRIDVKSLRAEDEDLYWMIRGYARVNGLKASKPWLADETVLSDEALGRGVIEEINKRIKEIEVPKLNAVQAALKNYTELNKAMALRHQEFLLREDGHHLIVPQQRAIANMMLDVGERFKDLLGNPQIIFDISTDELIALLKEPNPRYIMKTTERNRLYKKAEDELSEGWTKSPEQAVDKYATNLQGIFSILEDQEGSAQIERVKASYRYEEERLRARIAWLRDTVKVLKLKELLNERDVSRQALRAHVLLICGNDFLDNFQEAVELYAAHKVQKLLISGGLGRGTLSLIRNALFEGIPVHISENEIIMHENQLDRLVGLEKKGQLKNALKRTEADIIKEIILHMANRRKDAVGELRPVAIDEKDIILETQTSNMTEYFERTKPILRGLHEELGLGDSPLVVAYMHDPVIQFRTKGTFEASFAAELKQKNIEGISYALDHDIYDQDRETIKLGMLREMFALILFARAGHVRPIHKGHEGLLAIPAMYWEIAADFVKGYPDAEALKNFTIGMYDGLKKRMPDFPDLPDLLTNVPDNVRPFSLALEELFVQNQPGPVFSRPGRSEMQNKTRSEVRLQAPSLANRSILIYSPNHFAISGIRTYLDGLMPALAESNSNLTIHVVMLTAGSREKLVTDQHFSNKSKIIYHAVNARENSPDVAGKIETELSKTEYRKIDLVISHAPFDAAAAQFNILGKEKGFPVIRTYHGGPLGTLGEQAEGAEMTGGADVKAVPSQYVADKLDHDYGIKNVFVLNPVADLDFWDSGAVTAETSQILRAEQGIQNDFVIFMAGRLAPVKGFAIAVRAAKEMDHRGRRVAVVIASPVAGRYKAYQKDMIQEAGQDIKLIFLDDLGMSAMRNWYAASDVVVVPSLKLTDSITGAETFGLISIEAQSMGKPVIVSGVGGLPETLDNFGSGTPTTGIISKPGDSRILAGHLQKFYDQPALVAEFRKKAESSIRKRFAKDELIKKHVAFYARVISQTEDSRRNRSEVRQNLTTDRSLQTTANAVGLQSTVSRLLSSVLSLAMLGMLAIPVIAVAANAPGAVPANPAIILAASQVTPKETLMKEAEFRKVMRSLWYNDNFDFIAAIEMLNSLKDPRTVPALIEALKNRDHRVSINATLVLKGLKDSRVVPALIKALNTRDPIAGINVALLLTQLRDPRVVPALIGILEDKGSFVREKAAKALGEIKDLRAIPALTRALEDKDLTVRTAAAKALQSIKLSSKASTASTGHRPGGEVGKKSPATDASAGKHSDISAKAQGTAPSSETPATAKAAVPSKVQEKVKSLIKELRSDGAYTSASQQLIKIGSDAVDPLIEALKTTGFSREGKGTLGEIMSRNREIELRIADVLTKVGKPAVGPLINVLDDQNISNRNLAMLTLARIEDPRVVKALVGVLHRTADRASMELILAVQLLGRINDPRAVEPLIEALSSKYHISIRVHVARALGELKDLRAIPALTGMLNNKERDIDQIAREAIVKIQKANPKRSEARLQPASDGQVRLTPAQEKQFQKDQTIAKARSEVRTYEMPAISKVAAVDTSSLGAKIGTAIRVAASTVSPLLSSSPAYASEIAPELFAGTVHYQKAAVVPAAFAAKWPVLSKIINPSATASAERMVIDQRQGVPDAASVLPLVTFALYNPKTAVFLALIADASGVAAFEKELTALIRGEVLPSNFRARAFASENEFVEAFAGFYNNAAPLGQSVALITDREDSVVTRKIGSRRHLLSVVGAQNPLKQTASTLLAADKLLNEAIWSMGYHFVSVEKLGGLEALMAELTSYVATQSKVMASA